MTSRVDVEPGNAPEAENPIDTPPTPARSALMGRVRGRNTSPELRVRRAAHRLGYRFRIHRGDLPGTPDIVFPKHRLVIFVHGCFWHRHEGCQRCTTPKTRTDFWSAKFKKNMERDQRNVEALQECGWNVLIVWECVTKKPQDLDKLLTTAITERPNSVSAIV
jgi:DNA mismatch endonuclease (patch repair protein)